MGRNLSGKILYERGIAMKAGRIVFLSLASAGLLSACSPDRESLLMEASLPAIQIQKRTQLDAFVAELDRRRSMDLIWTQEEREAFTASMPDYGSQMNTFTKEEAALLSTRREPRPVSAEEAREDVEAFFTLLRTTYGGYDYFGGDETFFPLRDRVLAELTGEGEIFPGELMGTLYRSVRHVILDGHFRIGAWKAIQDIGWNMYYVPDLYFCDPEGMDPAYIRPTIGPDGQIAYCFAALSRDGSGLPRTAAGSDGRTVELKWTRAQYFEGWSKNGDIPYERRDVGGLPLMICETLNTVKAHPQLERMGRSGEDYRGLPVFIVDLRGNGGGGDGYAFRWTESFTGREVQPKVAGGVKFSQMCMEAGGDMFQRRQAAGVPAGDWEKRITDRVSNPNSSLIFVLTDHRTASAAEDFISCLNTLERIVIVGSNTAGAQTFGNVKEFYMPNSGLNVSFGVSFFFWDSSENREGIGYLPDLWVNPPDAVDAVERLCDYYELR